jgi:hypothetical protein
MTLIKYKGLRQCLRSGNIKLEANMQHSPHKIEPASCVMTSSQEKHLHNHESLDQLWNIKHDARLNKITAHLRALDQQILRARTSEGP